MGEINFGGENIRDESKRAILKWRDKNGVKINEVIPLNLLSRRVAKIWFLRKGGTRIFISFDTTIIGLDIISDMFMEAMRSIIKWKISAMLLSQFSDQDITFVLIERDGVFNACNRKI